MGTPGQPPWGLRSRGSGHLGRQQVLGSGLGRLCILASTRTGAPGSLGPCREDTGCGWHVGQHGKLGTASPTLQKPVNGGWCYLLKESAWVPAQPRPSSQNLHQHERNTSGHSGPLTAWLWASPGPSFLRGYDGNGARSVSQFGGHHRASVRRYQCHWVRLKSRSPRN